MNALSWPRGRRPVWTFIEMAGGLIHPASLEMLGGGSRLAEHFGVELGAVVLGRPGRNVRAAAMEAVAYGADTVYLVEDASLADYRGEACALALSLLVDKYRPRELLLGATARGRHLAGRLHACGLLHDCRMHTVPPLPAVLPRREPERAGHLVVEPLTPLVPNH